MVQIDQSPIGRTPRSNPATYTGIFDEMRKVFAGTRKAQIARLQGGPIQLQRQRGALRGRARGRGRRIEMNFLPDLYVPCPECHGARLNRQTLEVRYRGRSIADMLAMSVEEGGPVFRELSADRSRLPKLAGRRIGLSAAGQSSTTLSGGEAQRIKLATELARVDTGKTLYMLDEPTTGLHFEDIRSCSPC